MKVLITEVVSVLTRLPYKQNDTFEVQDLHPLYYRTNNGVDVLKNHAEILLPLSQIVQAHEKGKKIQFWDGLQWVVLTNGQFSDSMYYRIAPEPKTEYKPFTADDFEELADKWIEEEGVGSFKIVGITSHCIVTASSKINFESLLARFKFRDTKKPVGKEIKSHN